MPLIPPLPPSPRDRLGGNTHPGLYLDKYVPSWDSQADPGKYSERVQKPAVQQVVKLSQAPPTGLDWAALTARRRDMLLALGATPFTLATAGPLTLHLARASALENAGICLHPLYGFVYLPGTGLKGTARAYAETVWLATRYRALPGTAEPADPAEAARAQQAWDQIEAVFGWAPGSDAHKPWKPGDLEPRKKGDSEHAGGVVFHDAWPETWPKLVMDIVNNHHHEYYQSGKAPGDWENPVPVYFLAVKPGQAFSFALSPRRADVGADLMGLARTWLLGALCHEGAGAKTAAGYGRFIATPEAPSPASPSRERFETTLALVTPAFLAGAGQAADDCDLRPATLRGLLRWWWRSMHAGYVDVPTLRRLEAALWGDTGLGGAIRLDVRPVGSVKPVPYNKHTEAKNNHLDRPPDNKTTQGLWYHSYGMNDGGKQRQFLPPGTRWRVVLQVRDAHFYRIDGHGRVVPGSERRVPCKSVLDQAKAALWWLCMLGGVGSKSRKGFGNFALPPDLAGFEGGRFVSKGKDLRQGCGLPDTPFQAALTQGAPSLRQMVDLGRSVVADGLGWIEKPLPVSNVWQALDRVGMAAQMFAKRYKHKREKKALGLPRRIGHPATGDFRPGQDIVDRHASPIVYHIHREGQEFVLRAAAFPSPRLPTLPDSEALLRELLLHLQH